MTPEEAARARANYHYHQILISLKVNKHNEYGEKTAEQLAKWIITLSGAETSDCHNLTLEKNRYESDILILMYQCDKSHNADKVEKFVDKQRQVCWAGYWAKSCWKCVSNRIWEVKL
jgi:hypothetical protein